MQREGSINFSTCTSLQPARTCWAGCSDASISSPGIWECNKPLPTYLPHSYPSALTLPQDWTKSSSADTGIEGWQPLVSAGFLRPGLRPAAFPDRHSKVLLREYQNKNPLHHQESPQGTVSASFLGDFFNTQYL